MKHFLLLITGIFLFLPVLSGQPETGRMQQGPDVQKEELSPYDLRVYPNPCKTGVVTLEMEENAIAEIHLINIAGKEVLQQKTTFETGKYQLKLDQVPNGIYLLRVRTSDNKIVIKKLIVSSL